MFSGVLWPLLLLSKTLLHGLTKRTVIFSLWNILIWRKEVNDSFGSENIEALQMNLHLNNFFFSKNYNKNPIKVQSCSIAKLEKSRCMNIFANMNSFSSVLGLTYCFTYLPLTWMRSHWHHRWGFAHGSLPEMDYSIKTDIPEVIAAEQLRYQTIRISRNWMYTNQDRCWRKSPVGWTIW